MKKYFGFTGGSLDSEALPMAKTNLCNVGVVAARKDWKETSGDSMNLQLMLRQTVYYT